MLNLKNIKNIIFDLGGVLLNIDYRLSFNEFKKIGFKNFDQVFADLVKSKIFDELEKGIISYVDFRNELKKYCSKNVSDDELDFAWNIMLINIPENRIEMLRVLKSQYKLFLLSNTNEMHCRYYNNLLKRDSGIDNLGMLLHKAYYSHEINVRKPDREIYEYILNAEKLNPSETLFIDDIEENILAANRLGINGYWLKNGQEITTILNVN